MDRAIFAVHRKGNQWRTSKVPHWMVLVFGALIYIVSIVYLIPLLRNGDFPIFKYVGFILITGITILLFLISKIYISQLLNYRNPYSMPKSDQIGNRGGTEGIHDIPFRFIGIVHKIDYENSSLFHGYLQTNKEDFNSLILGERISKKMVWSALTDRKLPNFRLLFEFLNHITEENLEGFYGEKLVNLCHYIASHFATPLGAIGIKQLHKAHSSWKNCNPKRRMDLKIDIENSMVFHP